MKIHSLRAVFQSFSLLLCAASMPHAQVKNAAPADIIVVHGRVYTENSKRPWAQAVAIRNSRIVGVGDDAEIERTRGASTKVLDAGGKLVLPGFVDCHIHFLDGSFSLGRVNLEGAKDPPDLQEPLPKYPASPLATHCVLSLGSYCP